MANFAKLRAAAAAPPPTDPREIFKRLPKPPGINDLWDSQSAVLQEWDRRRSERDLVLKLNTGGGKTLAGLLIAQSLINERGAPALYLCPTVQLVEQTVAKAKAVQIAAVPYQQGAPLPSEFLNARAILVATYQALFNGRSKFGVRDDGREPVSVGAIICDDAHAAFGTVREQFTLTVDRTKHEELYADLVGRFADDFAAIQRSGILEQVVNDGDATVLEVPYWAWKDKAPAIQSLLLRDHAEAFRFTLPLLRDAFPACHALIRSREFVVTPFLPLVDRIPTLVECPRRIYMSATIADDSSLIRTFGAGPKAVAAPIAPASLAGVGERMVVAPTLTGLTDQEARAFARNLARDLGGSVGVVVLTASERAANAWQDIGTVTVGHGPVTETIAALTAGTATKPAVLANRYDGIDLPQGACRVLIMDGLPVGASAFDLFRATVLRGNSSVNVALAQRIEQGLGRGTRGAGDYCVVLLTGRDLVAWITQRDSLALMTPATRAQIEMGHEISVSLATPAEICDTVQQSLDRDVAWTHFHAEQLADRVEALQQSDTASVAAGPAAQAPTTPSAPEPVRAALSAAAQQAVTERAYTEAFERNDYERALTIAREAAARHHGDKRYYGWLLQAAARAAQHWGNEALARELQQEAYVANRTLIRPQASVFYAPVTAVGAQAKNVVELIERYGIRAGLVQAYRRDTAALTAPAASSNQFEDGMRALGRFLGFSASRPEKEVDDGPDVLWLADDETAFVIECKHDRKRADKPLPERDHNQLLGSTIWCTQQYADRRPVPLIVHPSDEAEENANATDTWVITLADLARLVGDVQTTLAELCASAQTGTALEQIASDRLRARRLTADQLPAAYFRKFGVATKPSAPAATAGGASAKGAG